MKDFNLILIGATLLITVFNFVLTMSLRRRVRRAERDRALRGIVALEKTVIKPWLPRREAPAADRLP